jgi:hypothetical protein
VSNPARRFVPIAAIAVLVLAGFLMANPWIVFGLLDPTGAAQRAGYQDTVAIGSRETPLTLAEANELYALYVNDGLAGADVALVHQDARLGLPAPFLAKLEAEFISRAAPENRHASSLLTRLARHRELSVAVERKAPLRLLGEIAKHRRLEDASVEKLLSIADARSSNGALGVLNTAALEHGLPERSALELERIARQRRGTVRSEAIQAIAAMGDAERARALIEELTEHPLNPAAIDAALAEMDAAGLLATVMDESGTSSLRVGALDRLVKMRSESPTVGAALTYAFGESGPLLDAAYTSFGAYGRHHTRYIDLDWPTVLPQHFDGPKPLRFSVASAFRFLPLGTREERAAFLLQMLSGTVGQQHTALLVSWREREMTSEALERIQLLQNSDDPDVRQLANNHIARIEGDGLLARAADVVTSALFWLAFAIPILGGLGWQTWFLSRFLQSLSSGAPRTALAIVNVVWLVLCLLLGAGLFLGLLGFGHGGGDEWDAISLLVVVGAVVVGLGWVLNRFVQDPRSVPSP